MLTGFQKPSQRARLLSLVGLLVACAVLAAGPCWSLPLIGTDVDLAGSPPEERREVLSHLADMGARRVRLALDWNRVEPTPGAFSWDADDRAVEAVLAQGLEAVLVLGPCAEWAVDPRLGVPVEQRRFSVPRSIDLWERYVREAVSRYRGRVRYWQVREQSGLPGFRGTGADFNQLVTTAARVARSVDPQAEIVFPQSGGISCAGIANLSRSPSWNALDVLGVQLQRKLAELPALALAWAVVTDEVLGSATETAPPPSRPLWVLGAREALPVDGWLQSYLLASAYGAECFFLPSDLISKDWVTALSGATYNGFLRLGQGGVWALVLERTEGPVLVAWSAEQALIAASELAPVADRESIMAAAYLGEISGSAVVQNEDRGEVYLKLGPRPALIPGLAVESCVRPGPPRRADVLAAREGPYLGELPLVYVDYSMPERPEFGLYQRPLRGRVGGSVAEEVRGDRVCVRTQMRPGQGREELDNPWIYLDVDDTWLYFADEGTRVAVTVVCEGSFTGNKGLGFNLMYEGGKGYRFTPWRWVEATPGWHQYRFELDDVSFANRQGYDFRINAKGSKQDLWVASVTVERIPADTVTEAAAESPR